MSDAPLTPEAREAVITDLLALGRLEPDEGAGGYCQGTAQRLRDRPDEAVYPFYADRIAARRRVLEAQA